MRIYVLSPTLRHCYQILSIVENGVSGVSLVMASQSGVWDYFEIISTDIARCKLCNSNYSRKGRTTSGLRNHLNSKHPEEYKLLIKQEEEKKN